MSLLYLWLLLKNKYNINNNNDNWEGVKQKLSIITIMAMVIVVVMLVNTLWGKFNLLHQWCTATSPSTLKPEIAPMTEKKKG